jgi:hypothetical protein
VRKRSKLVGHSPIVAQLGWCAAEPVGQAMLTHCGSEIVRGDGRRLKSLVRRLGSVRGIKADLAYDGLRMSLS